MLQIARAGPVRGGTTTVEQTRFGEQERARTHARNTDGIASEVLDRHDLVWMPHLPGLAADDHQRVAGSFVETAGADRHPSVADHSPAAPRQHAHVVEPTPRSTVGGAERVQWACQVQELVARMKIERDRTSHDAF